MFSEPTWAILELMGHRRLGGQVTEVELFGAKVCRIDIPNATDPAKTFATQFYGGNSIYCLTPSTEAAARAVAKTSQPAPIQPWELPQLNAPSESRCEDRGLRRSDCDCRDDDESGAE